MVSEGKTLFDKIWQSHIVVEEPECPAVLYIDLQLIHEVTSPQAFSGLRARGLKVRRTDRTFATMDHSTPTLPNPMKIMDAEAAQVLAELETRIVLTPPGEGEMLPVSATAVISINSAGSYVLGGNVFGVSGKHGIEIKKSNVTLDLNGYALIGTPGSRCRAPRSTSRSTTAPSAGGASAASAANS